MTLLQTPDSLRRRSDRARLACHPDSEDFRDIGATLTTSVMSWGSVGLLGLRDNPPPATTPPASSPGLPPHPK